ncbi:MAG: asparagine synthase (glutamine-hydrolyzing) [Bdellovibrionales bacterium]|nr:asparagine synthase (glutamine-hydrolyzing) [Bdellovibrionales bacterium]
MCGIAGFVNQLPKQEALKKLVHMGQSIHHRGPDSKGEYYHEPTGLGFAHARLSILDLSPAGHQPMLSKSERFVICYNGEIYNFNKLKKLLPSDLKLIGHSDTEILINCIEQIGIEKTLDAACGMFALAILDKQNNQVILARDRSGQKPLYYSMANGQLSFASELKAIKALGNWSDEIDVDNLALYMRHNYVPAPYSIFKNTFKLMPGTYIIFDIENGKLKYTNDFSPFTNGAKLSPKPYWQLDNYISDKRLEFSDPEMAIDQLGSILEEVISEQMISDVPLGAFLSGGVDSSSVVAIMQKLSSQKVKTFSVGFTDKDFNEAPFAKAIAEHLGTDHTELYLTPKDVWDVIPQLHHFYDEPFADSSQVPTYLVSKLARKEVTVSLSGDGGDEMFGGYNRYFLASRIWDKVGQKPQWLKTIGIKSIEVLPPENWDSLFGAIKPILPQSLRVKQIGDKLYKASRVMKAKSDMEMYLSLLSNWQEINEVVPSSQRAWSILNYLNENLQNLDPREKMMYIDFCSYMAEDILTKVDRASMAVSLEGRIPFLDRRVIEFAWKLPLNLKINKGQGKWILRQLLYKYVPKELIERPKMGFGMPIGEWLRGPLNDWAETLLSESMLQKSGMLDVKNIRLRWEEHKSGHRNWNMSLWNILMFQQWLIEGNINERH